MTAVNASTTAMMVKLTCEVREALHKLPDKFRQVVVLFYIEEFSVKEIKAILHIPEGTIKSRLSKARDLLKKQLSVSD